MYMYMQYIITVNTLYFVYMQVRARAQIGHHQP